MFDLAAAAPHPMVVDMTDVLDGIQFQARTVRVTSSTTARTTLLVGGVDGTYPTPTDSGVLLYGSLAAGSSAFDVTGSVLLPSSGAGITALSQTSPLHPAYVLASTDTGVFKCADRGLRGHVSVCCMDTMRMLARCCFCCQMNKPTSAGVSYCAASRTRR